MRSAMSLSDKDCAVQLAVEEYPLGHGGRSPPEGLKQWAAFAYDRKCSLETSTYQRIEKDLGIFRRHHEDCVRRGECKPSDPIIRPEMIEYIEKNINNLWKISIRNGKPEGHGTIEEALAHFAGNLPDISFYVNAYDEPRVLKLKPKANPKPLPSEILYDPMRGTYDAVSSNIIPLMERVCTGMDKNEMEKHGFFVGTPNLHATEQLVPIFSSATVSSCFADILFPSHCYLAKPREEIWAEPVPFSSKVRSGWNDKKPTAYWRGSNTGGSYKEGMDYIKFHRQRMVEKFGRKARPDDQSLDIGFTAILQCDGKACEDQENHFGPMASRTPLSESKDFKYLVDIDGNSYSQRILQFLRFTGSLVMKAFTFALGHRTNGAQRSLYPGGYGYERFRGEIEMGTRE
jgi:hypothetical protein